MDEKNQGYSPTVLLLCLILLPLWVVDRIKDLVKRFRLTT